MIRGQPCCLLQSLLVSWPLCTCIRSQKDSKPCSCVDSSSLSDKTKWHFTEMDNQKRELVNKDENIAKKWKVAALEVKVESDVNRVSKRNNWPWEYWVLLFFKRFCICSQRNLLKVNLLVQIKKVVVMKGWKSWQKNQNKTTKTSQIPQDIENAKAEIWEADSNLENSMNICQGIEKMGAP